MCCCNFYIRYKYVRAICHAHIDKPDILVFPKQVCKFFLNRYIVYDIINKLSPAVRRLTSTSPVSGGATTAGGTGLVRSRCVLNTHHQSRFDGCCPSSYGEDYRCGSLVVTVTLVFTLDCGCGCGCDCDCDGDRRRLAVLARYLCKHAAVPANSSTTPLQAAHRTGK